MVNRNKEKGSAYERSIVEHLREHSFHVDRTRAGWSDDRGDIHGLVSASGSPFTFECKNVKQQNLSGWLEELRIEVANNHGRIGAVVHKKRGTTHAGEQYATLPLAWLIELLKEAGYRCGCGECSRS